MMDFNSKKKRKCDDSYEDPPAKLDQSVLDCPICFDPLTTPVFQCVNGHVICSSCHSSLKPNCPSCGSDNLNLGDMRNRAVEKILEFAIISCPFKSFGCFSEFTFSSKISHEKTCAYSPYSCPTSGCTFWGSPTNLINHRKKDHPKNMICLKPNLLIHFPNAAKFGAFFNEGDDGTFFILNCKTMEVSSIQDPNVNSQPPPEFPYSFSAKKKFGYFKFKPVVLPCLNANDCFWRKEVESGIADSADLKDLLQVLDHFYEHDGSIFLTVEES